MADFLTRMACASWSRVREAKRCLSEDVLRHVAETSAAPCIPTLHEPGFDVIAEVKKRAPSAGRLSDSNTSSHVLTTRAEAYARGGAVAISVLTEPTAFDGHIADLSIAASAVSVPVMRKDFVVDPYQVLEARAAGASGVLLIAALLDPVSLQDLLEAATQMQMFVLLELFDAHETPLASNACEFATCRRLPLFLGVNARDLTTLEVDVNRFAHISRELPTHVPWIAESGIGSEDAIRRVAGLGYRGALIGTALMRADDPETAVASLVAAGRSVVAS